ncbi:MAG: Stp1/IreP family PP2C-type Ser/Thr phosphatase [Ferruginibacter sp.]
MFWKKKNKDQNAGTKEGSGVITDVRVVIKTDLGNVRTNNEDSASFFRVSDEVMVRERGFLLLVADGMGGHLAGEVASKMAVDIISEEYYKPSNDKIENLLSKAFNTANKKIFAMSSSNEKYKGMGTTCTALVIAGKSVYYAHAGDSRAYMYATNFFTRITEDHTYVQELVKNGSITAAEADTHPQRNILTNAMGTKPELRVDTGKCLQEFHTGNRLMICSDGLYDYLPDTEIGEIMGHPSIQDAVDKFIYLAKERGGMDNITVVLAEAGVINNNDLKSTREVALPKITRDADLPENITNI